MRFQTEMQHQIPDMRSAPLLEHQPYSPLSVQSRAASLEPQAKEHFVVPMQRPGFAGVNSSVLRYVILR